MDNLFSLPVKRKREQKKGEQKLSFLSIR